SHDLPGIVWQETTGDLLGPYDYPMLFSQWNGSYWAKADGVTAGADDVSNNPGANSYQHFRFNSKDQPTFVWDGQLGPTTSAVYYTEWNGTQFVQADHVTSGKNNVSNGPTSANALAFALNSNDLPIVVWNVSPGIYISRYDPSINAWEGPDDSPGYMVLTRANATLPSIQNDHFDNPAITWIEGTRPNFNVMFTHWINPCGVGPVHAQSIKVNSINNNVVAATLTPQDDTRGGVINYFMSNDGTNFEPTQPGVAHSFSTTGSQLRWAADLTGNGTDIFNCPRIDSLSIDYVLATPVAPSDSVTRIEGQDPSDTSVKISKSRYPNAGSADYAVLARDNIMIDAFAAGPLSNRLDGPLLLTKTDQLNPSVLTELQRVLGANGEKTIFIAGGPQAVSEAVEQALHDNGFLTKRLGGINRRETATKIAAEIITHNPLPTVRAFLTEDEALVDALGTAALAGDVSDDMADVILLNQRTSKKLDPFTEQFLQQHPAITEVHLVGGPAALVDGLETTIKQRVSSLTNPDRVSGADRYATNINLVKRFFIDAPVAVVVASGEQRTIPGALSLSATAATNSNLFGALLAGPYAADQHAPLLLTRSASLPDVISDYLRANAATINSTTIIGSVDDVSAAVENQLRDSI
ncbi:MAG: cell wall-binding repeat-containing protein, partial [Parcubacteria group bacterium]